MFKIKGQFYLHAYDNTWEIERTETNLTHFEGEVTWTQGNQT